MTDIDKYYAEVIKDDFSPEMKAQVKKDLEQTTGFAIWKLLKAFEKLNNDIISFLINLLPK